MLDIGADGGFVELDLLMGLDEDWDVNQRLTQPYGTQTTYIQFWC